MEKTMKVLRVFLVLILFSFSVNKISAQTTISAGNDTIICLGGTASLNAVVTGGGYGTDSYTFEVFPYSPEAYSGGTGVTFNPPQDDAIAGPFDIGFPFCFFNQTYTQFYIGSNGWIGFTYNSAWTTFTSQAIPTTNNACPKNCIMAPWEDWWPGLTGTPNPGVFYYMTGTAPNRKLVVYWPDCYEYWCRTPSAERGRFQIVLNEQSSIVENHITTKGLCTNRTATQGVHNLAGTVAFTATGRNSTLWSAYNESTRFVPSGVKWYVGGYPSGTIVGYGAQLNLTPTVTTTYTAVVQVCGGEYATDDITVTVRNPDFTYPVYSYCKESPNPVPAIVQPGEGTFTSAPAGLVIDPVTGVIDISASATGTYTITNTINVPCTVSQSRSLSIWPLPVPGISGTANACPDPEEYTFTTEPGMSNYQWVVSPDGTVTQGGTASSDFIKIKWATVGVKTISVNYTDAHSCTAPLPVSFQVTVHAVDVPTLSGPVSVCQDQTAVYSTQSGMNAYGWTVSPGGTVISGGGDADASVTVKWITPGTGLVTVNFTNPQGCRAVSPTMLDVEVKPLPVIVPENQTLCSGSQVNLNLNASLPGTTFAWTCLPQTTGLSGYSPGTGNQIFQTLTNSNFNPKWIVYQVTGTHTGCPGPPANDTVFVKPSPVVTFGSCFDSIVTAGAQPVTLKGEVPAGGVFTGTGVAGGTFDPAVSGPGSFTITYTYTNFWNCSQSAVRNIHVLPVTSFTCGDTLTDPRDGLKYPTVMIGARCWMAANLNYGIMISSGISQRENCISEKYCMNDNAAGCAAFGGLYQWGEMMVYSESAGGQGLCPPAWHVPSGPEWMQLFSNFVNNAFSGNALKITGYSGFDALLSGVRHATRTFSYRDFATFHWSSSASGSQKAWAHGMNSYNPSVSIYPSNRNHAFGVRCVKD